MDAVWGMLGSTPATSHKGGDHAPVQATHHHVVRIRNFSFKLKFSTLVVTLIYQKTQNKTKKSFKFKKKEKETKSKHYVRICKHRIKSLKMGLQDSSITSSPDPTLATHPQDRSGHPSRTLATPRPHLPEHWPKQPCSGLTLSRFNWTPPRSKSRPMHPSNASHGR